MNDERQNRKNLDKLMGIAREPLIDKLEKAVRENVELEEIIKKLLETSRKSLPWIAKVSADQCEGDPTGLGTHAMQQYARVEAVIAKAEQIIRMTKSKGLMG